MKQKKSHFNWIWSLFFLFFALALVDIRFGLLAIICMVLPVGQALAGKGRIHCAAYCPRGSFLSRFMSKISMNRPIPKFMRTTAFKVSLFTLLMGFFAFNLATSGGKPEVIAFALLRMVVITSIFSTLLGIFYKPRTWCSVCPMGYASSLVAKRKKVA